MVKQKKNSSSHEQRRLRIQQIVFSLIAIMIIAVMIIGLIK
jgi:predicted nucleic acid-binding Zn ribbon protein